MDYSINTTLLKKKRICKGYSQAMLAQEAGISLLSVFKIETGKTNPRPKTIKRICDALDTDVSDIINA